tara:strand:+ start:762 stop:1190 length:429 start_codon:yes stop_codon:yes gene_type:complete
MAVSDGRGARLFSYGSPGLGNVGSYQVSGVPWITGSTTLAQNTEDKWTFPRVAKAVTILNDSAEDIRIHFNSKDADGRVIAGKHYFTLTALRDSLTVTMKCTDIYISHAGESAGNASYTIMAELTNVEAGNMMQLTGSGLTD